ncbi:MAG TPA: hypothetical protein VHD55_03320 [Candidatus Paceibacterota bacterium]|nr:hypothetical protein [Candidatus Paceibacterota bacterium]
MPQAHHHAYIYEGPLAQLPALAESAREYFNFPEASDPDVQVAGFEKFGIEEARELVRAASLSSVSGRALYIVGVSSITTDAQQALLKLFEEPQDGTIFLLLAPYGSILATLRSRLLAYPGPEPEGSTASSNSAKTFLASPYAARSAEITKLLKDEEAVKERVRDLLDGLEAGLHAALVKSKGKKEIREGLEDIAKARSYANDRSPSMKMLLEHLAVSLPTLK